MQKPNADEVALRLLSEAADDRNERVEAERIVIERYSRLPDEAVAKMVRDQQARRPH